MKRLIFAAAILVTIGTAIVVSGGRGAVGATMPTPTPGVIRTSPPCAVVARESLPQGWNIVSG